MGMCIPYEITQVINESLLSYQKVSVCMSVCANRIVTSPAPCRVVHHNRCRRSRRRLFITIVRSKDFSVNHHRSSSFFFFIILIFFPAVFNLDEHLVDLHFTGIVYLRGPRHLRYVASVVPKRRDRYRNDLSIIF